MTCLGRVLVQAMTLEVVILILVWLGLVLGFGSCRPGHVLALSWLAQGSLARFSCAWLAWLILTQPGWAPTLAGLGKARAGPVAH